VDARAAFVARNGSQPGLRLTRSRTSEHGSMRGQKHLLCRVLRLDGIAEQQATEAEHHPTVLGKELAGDTAGRR